MKITKSQLRHLVQETISTFLEEGKKIMFYIMNKYYFKNPPKSYIDTINKGYINCNMGIFITNKFY